MKKLVTIELLVDSKDFEDENGEHSNEDIISVIKCELENLGFDVKSFGVKNL